MRKLITMAVAGAGLALTSVSWAATVVIDFDALPGGQFSTPHVEDGFVIDPALASPTPAIGTIAGSGNGTQSLIICGWCTDSSQGVSIYSQAGLTFELDSLDVFSITSFSQDYLGAGLVTGYYQGGGSISQAISANLGIETILFDSAWSDLTAIDITFAVSSFYPFGVAPAIDNVTLQAVPVPAAVWLFASGLGLLGWFRRRVS